jgi:hypothetical protein
VEYSARGADAANKEADEVTIRAQPPAKTIQAVLFFCAGLCFVGGVLPSPLSAQESEFKIEQRRLKDVGTLHLKLKPSLAAIRSDAPFWIDVELESTYADLMDGELDLTFRDDREVRSRLRTGPLAVPNGEKSIRLCLPAMWARSERTNFVVHVVFHGSRGTIDLGEHDLVVPLKGQRQFVMAAAGLGDATINRLTRQLGLDSFRSADSTRALLSTLPVEFELSTLPVDATGLYPFDLLVFAGEYFSRLSPRQLDTIGQWTESGGGLVVVPTGVLTETHARFLERLVGADLKSSDFVLDKFGRLPSRKPGSKDFLIACRFGFGRALILQSMPSFGPDGNLTDVDAVTWKRAVCFLWNVRPAQTETIARKGSWSVSKRNRFTFDSADDFDADERAPLHPESFSKADLLRALLFPEEVGVVPFRVVATILTLFLLAIAPADYFILGFLRRRKYTWILFPATCVVFTVATVSVARHYTGTIDHRGSLVITDLGEDGRPLRTTRIEHIITAGTHTISDDVKNGLYAGTDIQPQSTNETGPVPVQSAATSRKPSRTREVDPIECVGAIPSAFRVQRLSRQWSPSMARITLTGAQESVPPMAWAELDTLNPHTRAGQKDIADKIRRALPDSELLFLTSRGDTAVQEVFPISGPGSRFHGWAPVLTELSRRSDGRLFSLVSRISPNGSGDLEDLSACEPTDSRSCLLHVALRQGADLQVYRRFLPAPHRRVLD